MINSKFLDGMKKDEAIETIIKYFEKGISQVIERQIIN